jgi:TRAP-type C4-dicarboxylate transport system permease small subunit
MKKKLPLILLISTYACLLITFLILTIVGLDKDYKSNIDFFKPSIEISIGLYGVFYKGDIDVTQLPNFTLNISGIMCVVFAGLSVCSFGSFLYFNKGKYSYIYVAIATAMVLILFAIILSSYPNENNSSDTIG